MFEVISKKVVLVIAAIVAILLALEPTTDLTVAVLSFPSKVAWTLLGFLVGIINWPMMILIAIGFGIGFIIKTRTIDWDEVKAYFNKEEA